MLAEIIRIACAQEAFTKQLLDHARCALGALYQVSFTQLVTSTFLQIATGIRDEQHI